MTEKNPAQQQAQSQTSLLTISIPPALPEVTARHFCQGSSRCSQSKEIGVNSRSLTRGGQPWLPVMGEFHYARYPKQEWREALLKMKAGGIDIAASYIFWIHHEEQEGVWDWTQQRDLNCFVRLCGELGLAFIARIGPWCHGEVRNGGHPDWLLKKGVSLRSDDPGYLFFADRLYREIVVQLDGLLWKEGGPVIGIQIENEYGGPAEHLLTLKRLACEAGLDVPLYARTGWPDLTTPMPPGEMLPLFGVYADGFWDRTLAEMPPEYRSGFLFTSVRADAAIATDQLGERIVKESADDAYYPYFSCEIGGGMETSYHRRICIDPRDIAASALIKLGSGNNLQGYYMYQGGTNPDGRLSTLQESQETGMWNDLPVKSYDFQAPLGEFGQLRPHYHLLRRLHLFLRDFGTLLAPMPAYLPEIRPASAEDHETLRWAVRTDGSRGFVFVSNFQRLQPLPAKPAVQFDLNLPGTHLGLPHWQLCLPMEPVTIPADTAFFWPFNLDLAGAGLVYATAQPVCRIEEAGTHYFVFAETPGVRPEFVFDSATMQIDAAANENIATDRSQTCVRLSRSGTDAALRLQTTAGSSVAIVLLSQEQSLTCWKGTLGGRERLFLTRASLTLDGSTLRLSSDIPSDLNVSLFPAPPTLTCGDQVVSGTPNGLFRQFAAPAIPDDPIQVRWEQVRQAGPARRILMGSEGVAAAPTDAEFDQAAVWQLRLPPDTDVSRDLRLHLSYRGNAARLVLNGKLLTDNFYNGNVFEIGLKRYAPEIYSGELLLRILPLRQDSPIYLPQEAWPDFGPEAQIAALDGAAITEAKTACLSLPGRPCPESIH